MMLPPTSLALPLDENQIFSIISSQKEVSLIDALSLHAPGRLLPVGPTTTQPLPPMPPNLDLKKYATTTAFFGDKEERRRKKKRIRKKVKGKIVLKLNLSSDIPTKGSKWYMDRFLS